MIEERLGELKAIIARNDGANAADARFARAVDELVSAVYERIGEVSGLRARALFDLFLIKVLYVGRRSRHADVLDYLGELMESFLHANALHPPDDAGRPRTMYFGDVLDEQRRIEFFESRYEAYRRYADSALFLAGVFPQARRRRPSSPGPLRREAAPSVDDAYYVSTGKTMYRMAAEEDDAARQRRRVTLQRMAESFEVYADALNEMSRRYILGVDRRVVGDQMLDALNRHRTSGDAGALADARRYAALLNVDVRRFGA